MAEAISRGRPPGAVDAPRADARGAGYPDPFTDFAHAEPWCAAFFTYDNTMHKHSGIAYCTPAMVYGGDAPAVLAQRHRTMTRAFALTPARGVRGAPRTATLPTTVSIHPLAEHHAAAINTPYTRQSVVSQSLTGSEAMFGCAFCLRACVFRLAKAVGCQQARGRATVRRLVLLDPPSSAPHPQGAGYICQHVTDRPARRALPLVLFLA